MPLTGRYRAVIFDMDGLLLDTETLWHEAEVELFRRHGDEFTWDDKMMVIGTSFEITSRYTDLQPVGMGAFGLVW